MSIFSSSKSAPDNKTVNNPAGAARPTTTQPPGKTSPGMVSTLGPGFQVTGNIVCEGSVQIFGRVIGDIHASQLFVGEGAHVEGSVIAQETSIQGVFKGTIHSNHVKLQGKAVVEGEIYNKSLAIEQDVQFEGVSRRLDKPIDLPSRADSKPPLSCATAEKIAVVVPAGVAATVQ